MVSVDEINTKMIELQDEVEGEFVNNTDFYFDQIGEPLPIKPSDSDSDPIFDLQALPSQPLAVSELHRLIFVAHSDGFCVARTKDAIDSAKSSPSSSIQELSIVDVPIGKVHILALSTDNSTLAASVASNIHFFSVSSLLNRVIRFKFLDTYMLKLQLIVSDDALVRKHELIWANGNEKITLVEVVKRTMSIKKVTE